MGYELSQEDIRISLLFHRRKTHDLRFLEIAIHTHPSDHCFHANILGREASEIHDSAHGNGRPVNTETSGPGPTSRKLTLSHTFSTSSFQRARARAGSKRSLDTSR